MIKKVSIVMPAFNEEASVQMAIWELRDLMLRHGITAEFIVVDDGSSDSTARVAKAAGARVIQHRSNRGYGSSLKTGIAEATYDILAITDADGTYPSQYLPQMLEELEHADMVVGARVGSKVHIPLVRRPAKWLLNFLANYVSGRRIPDLNSGLRVFRRDVVTQYFPILPDQFSFTTTITMAMLCDKYAVVYVPIDYHKRKGQSKIVPWDAGSFAILILRIAMLFKPLRVFIPLALVCFAYGVTKTSIDLYRDPMISSSAILALISGLQLTLVGMLGEAVVSRLGRFNPQTAFGVRAREIVEFIDSAAEIEEINEPLEESPSKEIVY
ncbi:MAG TPA: glycosyltransferase family 2 protein [Pyrinomonadaceae bacterium]|nr:glycosyltransferase family 2 protein [Pyrinomonadaceae bacterium]